METGQPIVSVSQIQQAVKDLTSYDLDKVFVRKFLRQQLKMGYRLAK